jgi:uncharacterized protein (TIGR03437 family)
MTTGICSSQLIKSGDRRARRNSAAWSLILMWPIGLAAQTTDFTATLTLTDRPPTATYTRILLGTGTVGTLGKALLMLNRVQDLGPDYNSGVGPVRGTLTLVFNRLDQISIFTPAAPDPNAVALTIEGRLTGGSGAYAGVVAAAGGMQLTLNRTSETPLRYTLKLTGAATLESKTLDLTIADGQVNGMAANVALFDNLVGTGEFTPLGQARLTATVRPDTNRWDDNVHFIEVNLTAAFSEADTIEAFFIVSSDPPPPDMPVTITGGTGVFAGASGTGRLTITGESGDTTTATFRGSITRAGPETPIITNVTTAAGFNRIAQNDWIEIKGRNLAPRDTPAGGRDWSLAPEFAEGRMPTELAGVSVTVNGKPAHVWWFCSAATTPACASDQINVLTPLDDYLGQVPIVVKNGTRSSGAFLRLKDRASPALLLFSAQGAAAATHADGSLVGALNLFPGFSTPARPGETISLWGVGFGLPTTPLIAGASRQSGSLPSTPECYLAGLQARVAAALVSPGLYQINVTIPESAPVGESPFYCGFGGNFITRGGVQLSVQ